MANFEVKCFSRDEVLSDINKGKYPFMKSAVEIIISHEKNRKNLRDGFDEFLSDTYTAFSDSKNASGFVLYKDNNPISFVMFENVDFEDSDIVTTMVWTKMGYEGSGYARSLIRSALNYYANNTPCQKCYATINTENYKSLGVHDYFVRHGYGREYLESGKIKCELDITKFKNEDKFELLPTQNQEKEEVPLI